MATETVTKQTPINNTIQVMVPPGDETGLYYIPLANLPWQTSWQQLKDHVRTVCSSVERVEVFNESTSGWVSVRGRENYEAALYGKNGDQEIPIKKLVGPPADTHMSSPRSPRNPRTSPPSMQYPTNTPPMMPLSVDYNQWASPTPGSMFSSPATDFGPTSYDYMEAAAWSHMYDNGSMDTSSTMPTTMPQYSHDVYSYPQCYVQPGEYGEMDYSTSYQYAVQGSGSADLGETDYPQHHHGAVQGSMVAQTGSSYSNTDAFVQTERSKIIIKGLTTGTKVEQIHNLIRSKAGSDADKIHHISLPPSKAGGNRGHATITFYTEGVARKVIKKLNGYKFDGKTLEVFFTTEQVSKNELNRGKPNKNHHHNLEEREKKEPPKPSVAKDDKKDKSNAKRGVVIANGSSKKASENSKKH